MHLIRMLFTFIVLELNTFQKKSKKGTVATNIFRIQAYDSVIIGNFCIGFIDFMLKGKSLTDSTNLFSPNNFKKNDDIIINYFKNDLKFQV